MPNGGDEYRSLEEKTGWGQVGYAAQKALNHIAQLEDENKRLREVNRELHKQVETLKEAIAIKGQTS